MPLEAPNLDTRTYDDLKQQALLRIARYTPEWKWTDFNESDPGITLVELFAWLSERLFYEMNRVPERSYIKFLQWLGMELRPAQPAVAYLTFTPAPGAVVGPVAPRSQISAQPVGGGQPLIFETTEGLGLIRLSLACVQVFDGTGFRNVTDANVSGGTPFPPFGWLPQIGSALYLGFDPAKAVAPFFPQVMRFRVFLPLNSTVGQCGSCNTAVQPPQPPVTLQWEYRQEGNPPRWRRLNVYRDDSLAFTREGSIEVQGPGADFVTTKEGKEQESEMYWLRVRLDTGSYPPGRAPIMDFIRPNVAQAENLTTVSDEMVGKSTGLPEQIFLLQNRPVWDPPETGRGASTAGPLDLWVQIDSEGEQWVAQKDLLGSGPDDPHFALNGNSGEIRFGDGTHGRIPSARAAITARLYCYGGGAAGNVPAEAINTPLTLLPGVDKVVNERPASGGQDEQTLDDFRKQAPANLRHRDRAVSVGDFTALASEVGGVAKAVAIPLMDPDHADVKVPGAITVVIVPDNEARPPIPSPGLIEAVCRYLELRRLLTTELFVKGPQYQKVQVEARVAAQPYAAFDKVAQDVQKELVAYFNPLGRKDGGASGSDFGLDLAPTNLYSVILGVRDVKSVKSLSLTVGNQPWDDLTKTVTVPADGMFWSAPDHKIRVEPAQDEG